MKPQEYWNATYREISIFIQVHLIKTTDELKEQIDLQEAVTNKLIGANSFSKHPKVVPIRDSYKELFKEKSKTASPEDMIRRMRLLMKS